MKKNKVYIIILNWNGTNNTIECLDSLKKINYPNFQIILVDNASSDSNFRNLKTWCNQNFKNINIFLQEEVKNNITSDTDRIYKITPSHEKLIIIRNKKNLGFAAGNNVALNYLLEENDGYALLLNNDTTVKEDFLDHLVNFMDQNPKYVACTPQIRLYSEKSKIWNCGGDIKWYGNRKYFHMGNHIENVPQYGWMDVTFITGCCLMFKPQETGVLTERFFFGEEDFEFSLRINKQKKKMACVYQSVMFHKVGSSISNISKDFNKQILFYTMRLMDLKKYNKKYTYFLQVLIYMIYVLLKNKNGIYRYVLLWKNVFKYLTKYNAVDKQLFHEILSLSF
jgi:hypothetical protein